MIALDPKTLGETLGDVRTVAQATGRRERGVELVARRRRGASTACKLAVRAQPRPRVAALEWLDPVFVAGHWTPQLIELAGGEDVLGLAGEPSQASPGRRSPPRGREVVVVMPCGYDADARTRGGAARSRASCARSARSASSRSTPRPTSRGPGPRLIDGLELLGQILHRERFSPRPRRARRSPSSSPASS